MNPSNNAFRASLNTPWPSAGKGKAFPDGVWSTDDSPLRPAGFDDIGRLFLRDSDRKLVNCDGDLIGPEALDSGKCVN